MCPVLPVAGPHLAFLGGQAQSETFHKVTDDFMEILEGKSHRLYILDVEVRAIACEACGESFADEIAIMRKLERGCTLKRLHGMGLSIRQLERLTGIGRGISQSAVK